MFSFPAGTTWVYENSQPLGLDTFPVVSNTGINNPDANFRANPKQLFERVMGDIISIHHEFVPGVTHTNVVTLESDFFGINSFNRNHSRYQFGENSGLISYENLGAQEGKWPLISFLPN